MERADKSLQDAITHDHIAKHDPASIVKVASDLARSLAHVHERHLVHCDTKCTYALHFLTAARRQCGKVLVQHRPNRAATTNCFAKSLFLHRMCCPITTACCPLVLYQCTRARGKIAVLVGR
eukprot:scaffold381426_cov17-Prasinocladus_malaysianus.AAC.1